MRAITFSLITYGNKVIGMLLRDCIVRHCRWVNEHEILAVIRRRVFIEEQLVPEELEWDGKDMQAEHFLVYNPAGEAVGCARLMKDGKIGRMAILKAFRGFGLGRKMLRFIVSYAEENGYDRLFLDAQKHAIPFYKQNGFTICSESFIDAGIEHYAMEMQPLPRILFLGLSKDRIICHKKNEYPELLKQMALQARHRVCIFSWQLDDEIYGSKDLANALSELARSHPKTRVDILIRESRDLAGTTSPLVKLFRQLPDKVQIRLLERRPEAYSEEYFLADNTGVMLRNNYREDHGYISFNERHTNKKLLEQFDDMWQRSYLDKRLKPI